MTTMIQITLAVALILSIIVPFGAFFLGEKNKKRYKRSLACNCFFFFGSLLVGTIVMFGGTVTAQAATAADAGLATISEDGSLFGKSMIFVAMAEGIALYGLIISFMILGKLG